MSKAEDLAAYFRLAAKYREQGYEIVLLDECSPEEIESIVVSRAVKRQELPGFPETRYFKYLVECTDWPLDEMMYYEGDDFFAGKYVR